MPVPAIEVQGLSKRYRLNLRGHAKTFRETLVDAATAPWRRLKSFGHSAHSDEHAFWALKDIDFQVQPGEVLGVIGRNGAGKSTLLKILSRICEPTEGRAVINGQVASLLEVGTGFQPELSGRDNVYLSGAILGMKKREISQKFNEIVDFSGVGQFIDMPVKRYSSGMRVRLGFAVAAHLTPDILIIDEVLAVGDAAFQSRCQGKMGEVAAGGRTILFVSHNMAAVQSLCTRCILLKSARVAMDGSTVDVVPEYLNINGGQGEVHFGPETLRTGNGRARFKSVRILNPAGQIVNAVPMGEGATVEMEFDAFDGDLVSPIFGIALYSPLGQPVLKLFTTETHGLMPTVGKGGIVRLHIDRLDLLPGSYSMLLHVGLRRECLDRIENAMELEISPRSVYPTGKLPPRNQGFLMFAPCAWSSDYC